MEIKLPALGENVEEAEVLTVLVAVGDSIEKDQPLLELETDKATVEVPAPAAGVVKAIHVRPGDSLQVGQLILELEGGEAAAAAQPTPEAEAEAQPARGLEASRKEAHEDRTGEAEAERPTPRRAALAPGEEPRRPAAGRAGSSRRRAPLRALPAAARSELGDPAPASPAVRRLARELGVDVDEVVGSGSGGSISLDDVKNHVRDLLRRGLDHSAGAPALPAGFLELPDFTAFGEVEREPMSGVRRKTAENMTRSWLTIPHVTQFDRADVTELEQARKRHARRVQEAGGKLTVTALVIKMLGAAVKVFPKFNASLAVASEEIVYKKYVNVGVAVDTDYGLVVPVIRDVDRKNLVQIGTELTDLSERARHRKVRPEELKGANMTVTNLGGLGTTYFAPLINWPEVAVLGVGRAGWEAVWRDGAFVPRLLLPLSVSYDHRLIDGADAARFLRWIAEALEDPLRLALEG